MTSMGASMKRIVALRQWIVSPPLVVKLAMLVGMTEVVLFLW